MEKKTVHRLHQVVHKRLITFICHQLEPYDFNRGEFPILFTLIEKGDGKTQKDLCQELPISKSTISKVIDSLVEKGYLVREPDPEDRRAVRIYLTERKEEIEDLIRELDQKAENMMLMGFDDDEKEHLRLYLERILNNLEE